MRRPIIFVNGGPAFDRQFHGQSFTLNKTYTAAIVAGGGEPTMALDENFFDEYAAMGDGLILSGSQAYAPDSSLMEKISHEERNRFDQKLIDAFLKAGKPIMGICLGLQQLNVAFGGDLTVNFKLQSGVEHMMSKHTIDTAEESILRRYFGTGFYINSRHNIKIGALAHGLKVTATSPDGVIEAFEHETLPVIAFQWHPERMRTDFPEPPEGPDMTPLFVHFIGMVKDDMAKRGLC